MKYNDAWIKQQIKADEGFSLVAYSDTRGNPTVGWGHYDPNLVVGETYKSDMCGKWFDQDYETAVVAYDRLGLDLDDVRRGIVIMMIYNIGLNGVKNFKRMMASIDMGDYEMAGAEMLKSRWRHQVKNRAHRMAAAMITGAWV